MSGESSKVMQEVFLRKGKITFTTSVVFILSIGVLWLIPQLHVSPPRDVGALWYFSLAVFYFGIFVLFLVNWVNLRQFWQCVIRHQPALVLTADSLHAYQPFWGDYCVLPWKEIETFVPYTYKGHTTYYIVLKDYDAYRQQVSSLWRRFILWADGLVVSRSVINIDIRAMAIDADTLLSELNSRIG